MSHQMSRRRLLTAAAVAGTAAMSPLLTACGGGGGAQRGGANTKEGMRAALPTYVERTAVKPEIAPAAGGKDVATHPGYLTYPAKPPVTVQGVPGKGGSYTAVTPLWGTNPPAGNSYFQAMTKALGLDLQVKPADGNTYNTIVPTMTAAKKLPDWILLPAWWNPNFATGQLAGSQLADLTPYLAGDKVKKYPNLAALPTGAWQTGVWNDKLHGIPGHASNYEVGATFYRRDVLEAKGITADQVKSADDLMRLGKELTDAKRGVWAFDDIWTYVYTFWGAPTKWKVEDGKLSHLYETQEFLEALDWHYRLAKSGCMHPDALAGDNAAANTRFYSGKTLIKGDGKGAWVLADHQSGTAANPQYRRGAFNVFTADGKGRPRLEMGPASSMISYLNANLKPAQIEELLAVANYLAAPYGSAEYTMVQFGVEGVHHTRENGVPVYTEDGKKFAQTGTYSGLATPAAVISAPGNDQLVKDVTDWEKANVHTLVKPPFWGMNISLPQAMATAEAAQPVADTIKDCSHGKKTVSEVRTVVDSWKSGQGKRLKEWMTSNILEKYGTGL
ncbi:Tat pathway signal sequence domain protein [Streptomyces cremeus]|uniref:ABC transporter substrate-binding protein n=1 Tax=Streptomyces cremeus TaxID=66881 RepID=A0ABV5P5K4_STRCM